MVTCDGISHLEKSRMVVIAVPKKVGQAAKKMLELEEGTTKSSQSVEVSIFK